MDRRSPPSQIGAYIRRHHLGLVAIFISMSGTAYAVDGPLAGSDQVGSGDIINNEVQSADLKDANVTTTDLRTGSVTSGKVLDGDLTGVDIDDDSLDDADLGAGSVGASEIFDGSVGTDEQAAMPAVRVHGSVADVPGGAVFTNVAFNDNVQGSFDAFSMWVPGDPEHVTVRVAGTYVVTGDVMWENDFSSALPSGLQDQGMRLMQINVSDQPVRTVGPLNRFGSEATRQVASTIAQLDAGEQVSMSVAQENEDDSLVDVVEAHLALAWLGPAS